MEIKFRVLGLKAWAPNAGSREAYLIPGNWDDYSFKTSFSLVYFDSKGQKIDLGSMKIGYVGQQDGWTKDKLGNEFSVLPNDFFSLGQDVAFYKAAYEKMEVAERSALLTSLRDVAFDQQALSTAMAEVVFKNSLTRGVSVSTIQHQYARVLNGQAELTNYEFIYKFPEAEGAGKVELAFKVNANSSPSTNIHVLIGRNGAGKTTALNGMITSLVSVNEGPRDFGFFVNSIFAGQANMPANYFSAVVSVSFSAFDPFLPPPDKQDSTNGPGFYYVGMKKIDFGCSGEVNYSHKSPADLAGDFYRAFSSCLSQPEKKRRWLQAIKWLESDENFGNLQLEGLTKINDEAIGEESIRLFRNLSSGHGIVLLTITKLVDLVQEKTLVLMDEPECHLHPPLLSAFTRSVSDLLLDRNGLAIIATHSPVVLQEVPKSCAWILSRHGASCRADRPERESFGENVGILTREVFGLEVMKSGFHETLNRDVAAGLNYDEIFLKYRGQLGAEAVAVLLTLISSPKLDGGGGL